MKTIALVSCVNKKRSHKVAARDLYISPLFLKTSAYALSISDRWFILSAKHGLVDPDEVIVPYNQTLTNMKVSTRRKWAKMVLSELKSHLEDGDLVIFLAGKRYREFLITPLQSWGVLVKVPMEGLMIGQQLRWLNYHLGQKGER